MEQENKTPARNATQGVAGGQSKIVETYAEDMAKVLEDDKSGLVKRIIHQEEQHEKEKMNLSPQSRKNKLFMLASFLFIVASLTTLFYFLFFMKEASVVPVEKQFVPVIFLDKNTFFEVKDFDKDKIISTVLNEANGTLVKKEGVEGIYLSYDKQVVGLKKFLELIKGNLVFGNLVDNTSTIEDNFLMGVVNSDTKDFFMLLRVHSLFDVFDSMRLWERKMFFDLHGFFGIDISSETNYLLTKDLQDGIIENKNARILYDTAGKIVMMYVMADDNSIIIASGQNAVREIILRLASSKVGK